MTSVFIYSCMNNHSYLAHTVDEVASASLKLHFMTPEFFVFAAIKKWVLHFTAKI